MTPDPHAPEPGASRFQATLVRVLMVQAVALALLGVIQFIYNV
jgi:hypothetical protein